MRAATHRVSRVNYIHIVLEYYAQYSIHWKYFPRCQHWEMIDCGYRIEAVAAFNLCQEVHYSFRIFVDNNHIMSNVYVLCYKILFYTRGMRWQHDNDAPNYNLQANGYWWKLRRDWKYQYVLSLSHQRLVGYFMKS